MTVIQFPTPQEILWVCNCGNSTFILRPGLVCVCANCDAEITADEPVGAWARECEPPVPPDVPKAENNTNIIDLNDNTATERNFWHKYANCHPAAVIILQENGEINTYGLSMSDPAEVQWFDRQLADARRLLVADAGPPAKTANKSEDPPEPDLVEWIEAQTDA
jgi:hypothetical protein